MGAIQSSLSPIEMSAIKDQVEKLIAENAVVVFSKTYCPYCTRAKNALKEFNVEVTVVELDVEENGAAIQAYLLEKTGQRTVPNIFISQQHIGGCDDLLKLKSSGKLKDLLAKL
ncbi:Glutaredoxin-1 [Actinomortierella wolfii]|nr:Glutaredoxin-1 [Actinomortierella wolfii]